MATAVTRSATGQLLAMGDEGPQGPAGLPAVIQNNGVAVPVEPALNLVGFTVTDVPGVSTTVTANGVAFELPPIDLVFHEIAGGTLPGFMPTSMITLNENFATTSLSRFTIISQNSHPVTPTIASNQMTFSMPANGTDWNTFLLEGNSLTVPQFAVAMTIASFTSTSGNTYENPVVGYAKDQNNFVFAVWERKQGTYGTLAIQVIIGGAGGFEASYTIPTAAWSATNLTIGLSLVANTLTAWSNAVTATNPSGAMVPLVSYDVHTQFNFITQSLSGWKPAFGCACNAAQASTMVASLFEAGSFGGIGIRDICPVTNTGAVPSLTGSVLTATCTLVDPNGAAYCGVITYDLVAKTLTQVGVIFVTRSTGLYGAGTYNDCAAHVVLDGSGGYYFLITTWGNAGEGAQYINILYKRETSLNLLSGIVIESGMTQLTLPSVPTGGGTYDPFLVLNGSTWILAGTIGPSTANTYYPSMWSTPDLSTFTLVGSDSTKTQFEGSRITPLGGSFSAMWTNTASGVSTVRVYDLTFTFQGFMSVMPTLVDSGSPLYPPHPTLIPYGNYVYHVTFDNSEVNSVNGTQGQFRVGRALRYGAEP